MEARVGKHAQPTYATVSAPEGHGGSVVSLDSFRCGRQVGARSKQMAPDRRTGPSIAQPNTGTRFLFLFRVSLSSIARLGFTLGCPPRSVRSSPDTAPRPRPPLPPPPHPPPSPPTPPHIRIDYGRCPAHGESYFQGPAGATQRLQRW
ncbi:hypothetical protein C8R44DRAFT_751575 [Mycena epipterygia]|nr:hypothetical protein C8R44DRAFT_751575 [Mycena epipterygia]